MRDWARAHKVWAAVIAAVLVFGVIGAVTDNGSGRKPVGKASDGTSSVLSEAPQAPAAVPATAETAARARAARVAARAARRLLRQQIQRQNGPRLIEYFLKGTTNDATITYTSTGNGQVQRDVGVLTEWRSGKAKLRPGDFAQFSAQNSRDYGTVSCKIIEHMPDGSIRRIAPVTTSSGAFTIVECNGDVR
jgi:hypothetical protein